MRDLIKFRYRLMPYLYDLLWRYHDRLEPMMRPTFHDFPDDPRCFEENDDFLLGRSLLVASVVEPGQRTRDVYLPNGASWYDWWSGECFAGGETVTLTASWDRPPLLVRELHLSVKATGTAKVPEGGLTVLLPRQEARDIQLASGRLLSDVPGGDWRTVCIAP